MGGAASTEAKQKLADASVDDIKAMMKELSPEDTAKIKAAMEATSKPKLFNFKSGLLGCCETCPDFYKVVAEMPGMRLVEMTLGPGQEDKAHDHPGHSMYFVQGGTLSITDYDETGKSKDNAHEVEIPTGAPPIFPAGAHVVKNAGATEVKVVFIEPTLECKPCGDIADYISPFEVAKECYKILAENDEWITGMLTMEVGQEDPIHHHRDHLIYVLEGDQVTIYPGGDKEKAMEVPIKPHAGIPAPMSAPPFGKHSLKNSGTVPLKMLFFEAKK